MPVQVRCTILDAWGWCTGTTQRDGVGRKEGGGFRMGNTCIPVADLFWCLAKLIQCFRFKNKIKKKKKISSGGVLLFDKHLNRPSLITLSEKAMAPHSSTLAWKIPWIGGPGRLQSMGSWRVGHDWATSLSLFTFTHWRRKWQPTPVFLPGESQGRENLVGCRLWGRTESDTTEAT